MRIIVLRTPMRFSYLVLRRNQGTSKFLEWRRFYFYLTFGLQVSEIRRNFWKHKMENESCSWKLRKRHDLNMPGSGSSAESFSSMCSIFQLSILFINLILGRFPTSCCPASNLVYWELSLPNGFKHVSLDWVSINDRMHVNTEWLYH